MFALSVIKKRQKGAEKYMPNGKKNRNLFFHLNQILKLGFDTKYETHYLTQTLADMIIFSQLFQNSRQHPM